MLQNYLFGSRKPQIFFFYYFVDNLDWASYLKFVKFGLFVLIKFEPKFDKIIDTFTFWSYFSALTLMLR